MRYFNTKDTSKETVIYTRVSFQKYLFPNPVIIFQPDGAINLKSELAQDGTRKIGFFGGSPHYGKILDVSRGVFAVYRVASAGDESFSRFTAPLRSSLRCVSSILELSGEILKFLVYTLFFLINVMLIIMFYVILTANNSIGKNTEEILSYLKTNLALHPYLTLGCVQSLLRCIFKTNVVAMTKDNPDALSANRDPGFGSLSQMGTRTNNGLPRDLMHITRIDPDHFSLTFAVPEGCSKNQTLNKSSWKMDSCFPVVNFAPFFGKKCTSSRKILVFRTAFRM